MLEEVVARLRFGQSSRSAAEVVRETRRTGAAVHRGEVAGLCYRSRRPTVGWADAVRRTWSWGPSSQYRTWAGDLACGGDGSSRRP